MLKVFKHKYKSNNYILADVIRGKAVENKHGYVRVYSIFPFDTVRSDIFKNDYEIDHQKSNKEFILKLKTEILHQNKKYKKNMEQKYEKN